MISQKEICLTVSKIFNWNDGQVTNAFKLAFYSSKSHALIAEKIQQAHYFVNKLILKCGFRISYTNDQHIIILKVSKIINNTSSTILAQISINLEVLAEKKVQYYPFGENQKVLEISICNPKTDSDDYDLPENSVLKKKSSNNQDFIRQKQLFLSRVVEGSTHSTFQAHDSSRKSFSKQVYNLLQKVKSMRLKENNAKKMSIKVYSPRLSKNQIQTNDRMTYIQKLDNISQSRLTQNQRSLKKCSSQNFLSKHMTQVKRSMKSSNRMWAQQRQRRHQRHILILNNLNVIPLQEYFQQSENGLME